MLLADVDWNLPNTLSVLRLVLVPVYLWLVWRGWFLGFLVFLFLSELLDLVDGPIARTTNSVTDLGERLDAWGDLAAYTTLPFALIFLLRAKFRVTGGTVASGLTGGEGEEVAAKLREQSDDTKGEQNGV